MMDDPKHLPLPVAGRFSPEAASETMPFVQPTETSTSVADLLPSRTSLGHYVIKKYIGGGGMGRVYLATDEALDRDVAIKVLPQQRVADRDIVARFMNEAKSAARLNHEHIAQVYFAGEESGIPFIAFEYVEGINVRTMVEEHDVFPLPQALNYLLQIVHALAHAATHGVVHRDVKPSNILITREGRAKLIDMGLARLRDTSETQGDLTASGVTLGTFDYISPEQARDPRNADIRSDIYSLGCTFFFMLAGRPPFPEGTVLQKLLQHQGDVAPDIRSFQPSIPAEIAFLIQKMMAKDPKQRFQTPTVLIEALTEAARRLGLRPAGQGNLVWTPTRSKRASFLLFHLPWITTVSLLLFGFFLMSLFSKQPGPIPLPDQPQPVPLISEISDTDSPPSESIVPSTSTLAVAFVSHSVPSSSRYSASLGPSVVGGSLLPVAVGAELLEKTASGTLSVADFELHKPNTSARHTKVSSDVRCVDPTGNTIGSYLSLASALNGAKDGTTIELKWDKTLWITEPIVLDRRKLQFVAAAGCNPILLFEPTESQDTRSFITVFSSGLSFRQVGIEIRLNPNVLSPHWSLFELSGNARLTFEKCCLTIRNRSIFDDSVYHDDVVFFRNGIPTGETFFDETFDAEELMTEPLTIHLTDSLLRGEAVAIQNDVPQDLDIRFSNSLVALAKPFIRVEKSRRAEKQTTIQIRWNGVLFLGRQGVVSLNKRGTVAPIVVEFDSQQSIFIQNNSPFAVFDGVQSRQTILDDFRWSGRANYFQGISGLLFRTSYSPQESRVDYEMTLEEWRLHWTQETKEQTKIETLTLNEIVKPMSQYLPQDMRNLVEPSGWDILPNLDWFPIRWNGN